MCLKRFVLLIINSRKFLQKCWSLLFSVSIASAWLVCPGWESQEMSIWVRLWNLCLCISLLSREDCGISCLKSQFSICSEEAPLKARAISSRLSKKNSWRGEKEKAEKTLYHLWTDVSPKSSSMSVCMWCRKYWFQQPSEVLLPPLTSMHYVETVTFGFPQSSGFWMTTMQNRKLSEIQICSGSKTQNLVICIIISNSCLIFVDLYLKEFT